MYALNVVFSASSLSVGESFCIKIIQIDDENESQIDTCFTFGVTSCPMDIIEEQHELHLTNLCSSACGGITNSVTLRKPEFKRIDSIITFTRCEPVDGDPKQFIEISVDGRFVKFMRDYSQNQILSLLPTLVPFIVLNGVVTAILYHEAPTEGILDSPSNFVFVSSDDESEENEVIAISAVEKLLATQACASSGTPKRSGKVDVAVGTDLGPLMTIDRTCSICLSAPRTHLTLPCYHFAYCQSHANDLIGKPCAMCRIPVISTHACYDS